MKQPHSKAAHIEDVYVHPEQGPYILAVMNASPDSFSGSTVNTDQAEARAQELIDDGADILDIGAQSLRTDQPEIPVTEELKRLMPVLEAVRNAHRSVPISIDTYRAEVIREALAMEIDIINDPSGDGVESAAPLLADSDVSIIITYNRSRPKVRLGREDLVADPVGDAVPFLEARIAKLESNGIDRHRIIIDVGADLGKSPEQTIAVLRATPMIRDALGVSRVLWALSRKDFVGALVQRLPSQRGAGTLGALAALPIEPDDLLRVHDVRATREFFLVKQALEAGVDGTLELPVELRHG